MKQLPAGLRLFLLVGSCWAFLVPAVRADIILEQYEFQGQTGAETTLAASNVASGLTGTAFGESGVTAATGANSIASTGWNAAGANYSFGFTVGAGMVATVNQITLTSRSSGTGPGFLNVIASTDGGKTFRTVATITQTSTNYNDEMLAISPVVSSGSILFEIVAANSTSAAGGTTAATGSFRVGDYNPTGAAAPTAFTLTGTITAATPTGPVAVPEPSAIALTLLGIGSAGLFARVRRRDA